MASIVALHSKKNAPELRFHRFGRIPYSSPPCPSDAIWDRLTMNTPIHSACRSWVSFTGRENFQEIRSFPTLALVELQMKLPAWSFLGMEIVTADGEKKPKYGIFT